jgi:putative endopeptidase
VTRPSVLAVLAVLSAAGLSAACARGSGAASPSAETAAATATPAPALPPLDQAALDQRTEACQDFYQYACGGWLAKTEIPADKPGWSRGFFALDERNSKDLRRIAEDAAEGRVDPRDRFARKVGDYYASCMDEAGVEARGLADLQAEWARIDAVKDARTLVAEIARLNAAGVEAPFTFTADQDAKDATQVIGILYQGGLTLPDREYYFSDDEKNRKIRELYATTMRNMLGLAGVAPADAAAQAKAVEDLERRLAEAHWARVELREPSRIYNRVDRAGLEKLAPSFDWGTWLSGLGHPEITAVSTSTPRYVERVGVLMKEAPLDAWKTYLKWHLLSEMAVHRALPKRFVEQSFAFTSGAFTGAKEMQPRWQKCVDETDAALGFALGQTYVRRHFGEGGKKRTSAMVVEIEKAMERDIAGLPWMDEATKARAREKLGKVFNKVGYPDQWRDYGTLNVSRESFFRNVLAAQRFEVNRQLTKIGKPLDRTEWLMSPPAVNAYYNASMNEMVFPAGILQPPFFNPSAPDAVNYGAMGMVVGHELTHGFDDEGRQYDAFGNLTDWWSPAVGKEFDRRAQCVVDQYSAYEPIPGAKLNAKLTLGENIADLGGLKLAYAAMSASRQGNAGGDELMGFTPDQQFFVGYAQSWCFKARDEYARMLVTVDPHSPAKYRVNGPLANLPEFAEAFGCKEGDPMVRPAAERCEVW